MEMSDGGMVFVVLFRRQHMLQEKRYIYCTVNID